MVSGEGGVHLRLALAENINPTDNVEQLIKKAHNLQ